MIDHVSVSVADLGRATAFYDAVLGTLGFERKVTRETTVGYGKTYPEYWLNLRPFGKTDDDTGFHVALRCRSTDRIREFHAAALAAGGRCDGPPGPRPAHLGTYFAAFVRDPDGNRIEVVAFTESGAQ